jgi:hypothetical protein
MDRIVGGKFKLGKKIGCGSFGVIYLGKPIVRGFHFRRRVWLVFFSVLFLTLSPTLLLLQARIWTPTRSSR